MPIYSFKCGSCSAERDYSVSKMGGMPLRCIECDATDNFQRVYANEGFSIGSQDKANKLEKIVRIFLMFKVSKTANEIKNN